MPSDPQGVAALVLAAGRARRFGSDKRAARLSDGQCALDTVLGAVSQAFDHACLVLAEGDAMPLTDSRTSVIHSLRADQGMGASLADGVAHLAAHSPARALAVVLGDMPWIRPQTYRHLVGAARDDAIVAPYQDGQRGHPILFGRHFWADLMQLEGDQGARGLLQVHARHVRRIDVEDAAILFDIDHPDDLLRSPHGRTRR